MTRPDAVRCEFRIDAAGLPGRSPAILKREQNSLAGMIGSLSAGATKGEEQAGDVTVDALLESLATVDTVRVFAAAFLAGRCKASTAATDQQLTRRLADHIARPVAADTRIEAAFSLVLRGAVNQGRDALRDALTSSEPLGDQYKAAFFLAQLGDPSGYAALIRTAGGDIAHYRLMALRHAIAFSPWNGKQIGELTIDVASLLSHALSDPDPLVRQEMPFYLEELGVANLRQLLEPVARGDDSEPVRTAARIVLDRMH